MHSLTVFPGPKHILQAMLQVSQLLPLRN